MLWTIDLVQYKMGRLLTFSLLQKIEINQLLVHIYLTLNHKYKPLGLKKKAFITNWAALIAWTGFLAINVNFNLVTILIPNFIFHRLWTKKKRRFIQWLAWQQRTWQLVFVSIVLGQNNTEASHENTFESKWGFRMERGSCEPAGSAGLSTHEVPTKHVTVERKKVRRRPKEVSESEKAGTYSI